MQGLVLLYRDSEVVEHGMRAVTQSGGTELCEVSSVTTGKHMMEIDW